MEGKAGFLLFGLDSNADGNISGTDITEAIAGGAFYVDLANNDAAYLPTIGMDQNVLGEEIVANWTQSPLLELSNIPGYGAESGFVADMEFLIDGAAGGDNTTLYIWTSTETTPAQAMTVYDGSGATKAITVQLLNDNLNVLDVEGIADITPAFNGDGFIRWTIPSASDGIGQVDAFIFSIVEAPFVGASQTLLADVTWIPMLAMPL